MNRSTSGVMSEHSGTDPLYPPIEPYASGMLEVGDGQQIYWEECGSSVW